MKKFKNFQKNVCPILDTFRGVAPRIIETFLESYDMSGKVIAPFCTSGGSGVGRSDTALHKNVSGNVTWMKGKQINRPNENEIRKWLEEIL